MTHSDQTVAERIRRHGQDLTRTERRLAQILMGGTPMAGLESVARFAARARASGPSALRFVAKLGFASYAQFQQQLRQDLTAALQSPLNRSADVRGEGEAADAGGFFGAVQANLTEAARRLDPAEAERIVALLADARRPVYLLGGRFSENMARWVHQLLREMRPQVHLIADQTATWVETLVDIDRRAVVIAFDFRRYQDDVVAFGRAAAARGAVLVVVTDEWMSPLAAQARHVVVSPVAVPSLFDSTIAGLVQMEALVARLGVVLGREVEGRIGRIEDARGELRERPPG